ncbi:MAG: peptide deformylase [Deferribacterota bacterium]|nr:peptide deformylase [Deferribacterota bacterium]
MVLDIVKYPDKRLRAKCAEINNIDEEIIELLNNMEETMLKAPGVGLAAPQVGVLKRVIVVNFDAQAEIPKIYKFINPEILEYDGEEVYEEGCLSIPGEYADVKRAKKVYFKALNEDGKEVSLKLDELPARIVQHEIDHLNGVLFIDRIPQIKRDSIKKHIKKRALASEY